MTSADPHPLEAVAERAYVAYLDHLWSCPRCGMSWRGKPCGAGKYLRGNLRAWRTAVRRLCPPRAG
ncbi:hypothetical protein [Streptomyces spectabilis]|uniref:Transposase n=1 Tax=Streptomyces spectabilis TaxID=68270 RepID=A0A5P2X5G9_STRST|nr:hypothetical protein [Streptomyces spectabilis]MBB5103112.1 hypothetical protein [Streptomyces spectabilis]MCI3902307.1 hypothetical protein [Streptomyces spectabilis]QEV59671.1 hypothetical protein CP982_13775 [Streptomyces spectabilis]GGV14710.1 hypothetical protein GCM10010245_25510 [Streptomyces spectabilis]